MKIAVIGAGFLGLAAALELSQRGSVDIFDKKGVGSGASGMAAGLLHPFAGKKATLNWMGLDGYSIACRLLDTAEQAQGMSVCRKTGIFRPAVQPEQHEHFRLSAERHPDLVCWQKRHDPDFKPLEGIFIACGIQVDCKNYLEGLFAACKNRGCSLHIQQVATVAEFDAYDLVVFAVGADFSHIVGLEGVSVHAVKGQLIEFAYDKPLTCAISAECYIAQLQPRSIIVGSTYEHFPTTVEPDLKSAEGPLREKLSVLSTKLAELEVIDCKAGIRATTADKKPFIKKIGPKHFCIGGLGSKGLLYHGLVAQKLCEQLS